MDVVHTFMDNLLEILPPQKKLSRGKAIAIVYLTTFYFLDYGEFSTAQKV